MTHISRRKFGQLVAAGSAWSLLPGRVLGANGKINMAFIGCGAQGASDARTLFNTGLVNVVALCDVHFGSPHTKAIEALFPSVPKFTDFRKMFDKMAAEIDACTVGVPDHSHFPIAMLAMSLGKHVYVEKPLAHTFEECDLMMAAEKKYQVVCQMGNQGHSGANYFQFKAWKEAGIIKDVTKVTAYMNSKRRWHGWNINGYPKGGKPPEGMDWDTWLGTAPAHDFDSKLHPGDWRSWFDYGNGAFGDWGPHILDTIHQFLDLGMPEKITAVHRDGPNEFIFPQASTIRFDFPRRGEMPPVEITWHDGVNNLPPRPAELEPGRKIEANGKIIYSKDLVFKGTSHSDPLRIIPETKMRDLAPSLPKITGKNSDHYRNFLLAVKGEEQTRSPLSIGGPLSQVFCLGVIAQRLGGELHFDREKRRITNHAIADQLLKGPPPRKGWEEFYKL
ncbi:MAG: Gfo/Idh/MocA family oxidoreductase [Verrucomicrobiales bacterium]|nr:Gfo/Idh/MocA family oxidoreductase [Verrucomicrobiales bacterium]